MQRDGHGMELGAAQGNFVGGRTFAGPAITVDIAFERARLESRERLTSDLAAGQRALGPARHSRGGKTATIRTTPAPWNSLKLGRER